jgi:hypothetical protein
MFCQSQTVDPQTAYVLTLLSHEAARGAPHAPANLIVGKSGIADRVKWTLLDEQLDAGREPLADVEAARALLVVPIEAIPKRPMARSGRWTLLASGFATPHVLLAVDDPVRAPSPATRIGAASLSQRHAKSLHKTPWLEGKPSAEVGW